MILILMLQSRMDGWMEGWMEGSCKEIQLKTDYVTEDRLMQLQTIKPEKKGSRQKILEN
jgi:hypothetical protein